MKKPALFLLTAIIITGLCGCDSKSKDENYFGGEGKFKASDNIYCFYDDDSIYCGFNGITLKKYNNKTNTFYVVCDDPECEHIYRDDICKANTLYCVFNGDLINTFNERIVKSDGTIFNQGYLYLCDANGKKVVFKNELPDEYNDPERDNYIGFTYALGDDYLVLCNPEYIYILDTDYNIKYTVPGRGRADGGVFLVDNEIYYADDLFRLQKINKENGELSYVDLNSMKVLDCFVDDDVLWFSNGKELCSYDFKSGEVKVHTGNALFLRDLGKYIQFGDRFGGREGAYLFDKESGEVRYFSDEYQNFLFSDGIYYKFDNESGELTLYEEDLTTVIKTCTLSE